MIRVLRLLGLDDTNRVVVRHLSPDPAQLQYDCSGNVDVDALVDRDRFQVVDLLCGDIRSTPERHERFDVALSAICDADGNGAALRRAGELVDRLGLPVVNHPAIVAATTRDGIARTLDAVAGTVDGLVVPNTVRIRPEHPQDVLSLAAAAGVAPPMLVRPVGSHGGAGLVLVRDAADLEAFEAFALDGRPFYATEYVDCSGADGWTRKWRVVLIGGVPFPRHLLATRTGWNVHADERPEMDAVPELLAEERAWADGPEPFPLDLAAAVHQRVGLDYLGLDYGRDRQGRRVLFEANACFRMAVGDTIANQAEAWQPGLRAIRDAFMALLADRADRSWTPAHP